MEPLTRLTPATGDVLSVLLADPAPIWGLAVVKASDRPAGSVYPILERLERLGWVTSAWDAGDSRPGPRRRYYALTADGRAAAIAAVAALRATRARPQVRPKVAEA
ncbi:PadR family transcriptional regulator [Microlunatus speluncae]|uniref:PadR family transcriptional regulator n=1 Tax=Microlunatus speluncae TaxID=2594267 RepID=UPI0012662E71|nr:PadR family transcriptional regulator [Microlunatus speluncae]